MFDILKVGIVVEFISEMTSFTSSLLHLNIDLMIVRCGIKSRSSLKNIRSSSACWITVERIFSMSRREDRSKYIFTESLSFPNEYLVGVQHLSKKEKLLTVLEIKDFIFVKEESSKIVLLKLNLARDMCVERIGSNTQFFTFLPSSRSLNRRIFFSNSTSVT